MNRGRPPQGPNLVDHFDADPNTKERLKLLLQTLTGQLSVADACRKLGISQARFFELRAAMLQGALDRLQPKPLGRPVPITEPDSSRIRELEQEILDLRLHLAAAQLREEIALAMPHLSNRHPSKRKKKNSANKPHQHADAFPITRPTGPNSEFSTPGSSDT
jgi:transposase-like protein